METLWRETCNIPHGERLQQEIETEVAVIGAGMAGILTAYLLKKEGKEVVVLEANHIASGQTEKTTAKITSQHGLIYDKLVKEKGIEYGISYARANELAIKEYEKIIQNEEIFCDFKRCPSYIYSENMDVLKAEEEAARKVGLDATFTTDTELPFSVVGAGIFENQARFHPLKFIQGLVGKLTIYENTKVINVKKNRIMTERGSVTAKHIVFACHYPFLRFSGIYPARIHQERSYVLALKNAISLDGMYLGVGKEAFSFRNYKE